MAEVVMAEVDTVAVMAPEVVPEVAWVATAVEVSRCGWYCW
jgi:hypothetical protein